MRKYFIFLFLSFSAFSQKQPEFLQNYNKAWVENILNRLTLEEKIGQVLMPRGNFSGQGYDPEKLKAWVRDYKLGGLVFFAGQPTVQAQIVNELQAISSVPLLIGVDMEWGLAMRLDSTDRFPYQLSLGAMQGNDDLIYRMGVEIGKQAKRLGIHVNYAPVVDINNNPKNPVINFRSFGEDKVNVATKALAYMKGMQSQHLLVTAKHFPGHGDTGVDSHYDLPLIPHSKKYLMENELVPFRYLIENGLSGIMTAHLNIPALEPKSGLASTFSSNIIDALLKKDLAFQGLTFTDAMDMQGAVKNYKPGEALVEALLAGNDILETFVDVPTAFNAIKEAVESGKLPVKVLDERVEKILKAKAWVGLDNYKPIKIEGLIEDLNTLEADFLNRTFAEKTLISLKTGQLPIKKLDQTIQVVALGAPDLTYFQNMATNYTNIEPINLTNSSNLEEVKSKIKNGESTIVVLYLGNIRPGSNYGLEEYMLPVLNELGNTHLVIMGNPYVLDKIPNIDGFASVTLANQLTKYTEEAAAMAVFGAIDMNGRLPVTVNANFKIGSGTWLQKIDRLAYGIPEMVGLDSRLLNTRLDSVMNLGIKEKAYPGAVLEVAKNGRVIYQKPFGFHTYEESTKPVITAEHFAKNSQADAMDNPNFSKGAIPVFPKNNTSKGQVKVNDLYDLASVTKISTSALAIMQLMSEGKFDLDKTFGDYYPPLKDSNKGNLKFRDMLTHRAGLKAWIPFWMNAIDSVSTLRKAVKMHPEYENLFIKEDERQGFFARLFNKTPQKVINYEKSLAQNPSLWTKLMNSRTLTWHPGIFSNVKSKRFSVEITDSLFMNPKRIAYIYDQIKASPVKPEQGYVYSDLHYYYYPIFMEKLTGKKWEDYLKETYQAIGANSLTYNPRRFYAVDQIVPSEKDTLFRKTVIHGRVHDEGAGLLNGVSGHAGLFGNANDLTKLMQMYLQNGNYGGTQFIKPEVLKEVTSYQFPSEGNRRGIAFDKLDFNKNIENGPQMASPSSYGHSGFTGTFTWVDPKYDLVYVFLSNRVYPTRDNNKISTLNLRTAVGNEIIKTIIGK